MSIPDRLTDNFIECPWCEYQYINSFEMPDGEYDCEKCGKRFTVDSYKIRAITTKGVEVK